MIHPERKLAKRYDMPGRARSFTDIVYSGEAGNWNAINEDQKRFLPPPPAYKPFIGELHGHSNLSDGYPDIDTYYKNLRDNAKVDFAALSDHDHGGVGKPELWKAGKWDLIRQKAKEYYEPGKFTTLLAYERDSYPWYNNLVIYYNNHDGEMLRGVVDGEITRAELREWLAREDLILVPHDANLLSSGSDFLAMELEDMVPIIQVYSRYNCCEYFGDPVNPSIDCEGGHWQDALKRGARMGCIACGDDHVGTNGLIVDKLGYPSKFPGLTGVWAEENTLPSIFAALKARRCYGFMGGRIIVDFRIDGHYMGEEFTASSDPAVYYHIEADAKIESVTLVKNCRDYMIFKGSPSISEQLIFDYHQEQESDSYYLRVKLSDGRMAWSSPIWVRR
ncbi:MAG: DUF3604 domain-containing protein [Clostridia bacterium]|nr:DUF3604 domain-containing protein [Clostridia bacterium]